MRYFRARRYVHASKDGVKTFCGLKCNTYGCHWEKSLWEEVTREDYLHNPCPDCVNKSEQTEPSTHGKQLTLQET